MNHENILIDKLVLSDKNEIEPFKTQFMIQDVMALWR